LLAKWDFNDKLRGGIEAAFIWNPKAHQGNFLVAGE